MLCRLLIIDLTIKDSCVEIFLPESALIYKTLPFLWQTPEFAFIAFDSGVVTGNGAVLIKKFRLGLSLTQNSFSLFPSFYPVSEGGIPIGKNDLKISDTSIVFPSSFDILYCLSSGRNLLNRPQFNILLDYVKFDESNTWFSSLLNSLLFQRSNLDFFLKEFLNVVIFAYSQNEEVAKSFGESCSALIGKYSNSAIIRDFLCSILYDNGGVRVDGELLGLLRAFVPQLMFFVRDAEIPFFLSRMPEVEFSATRAFLECCGVADRVEKFLTKSKKQQDVFENLLKTSKSKETLKSLRQSAEKAIQDISLFLGDVLHLVNPEDTEDFLFFKRIIALYFTKQSNELEENIKDKLQKTKAQMGKISTILGIVRFYKEKIEDIDTVLDEK